MVDRSCHTERGIHLLSIFARDQTARAARAECTNIGFLNVWIHLSKNCILGKITEKCNNHFHPPGKFKFPAVQIDCLETKEEIGRHDGA